MIMSILLIIQEARCIIVSSHSLVLKAMPAIVKSSKCQNVIKIDEDNNEV